MNEAKHNLDIQTGRIEYIDIFRAFGIILMVMDHVEISKSFDHFIHTFHMPMFFLVSGFLYKNNDIPFFAVLMEEGKELIDSVLCFWISAFFLLFYY